MEVDLEIDKNITINWELEIEHANRGWFSMSGLHNLVLSYSQENNDCFHTKSKIVKIDDGKITEIFETKFLLNQPSIDKNGNIYICSHDDYYPERKDNRDTLLMINPEGKVVWEYLLDDTCSINPVIYHDSVLVYDFNHKAVRFADAGPIDVTDPSRRKFVTYVEPESGHLYNINQDGTLIWKKSFDGNAYNEPLILKRDGQDSIFLHAFDNYLILDMNGNTLQNKKIGRPDVNGLFANEEGGIYACIHPNLLSLNMNLDIIWAYKPDIGFVTRRPNTDSHGNLYCGLQGSRMVSLDSHGKERWIAEVTGDFGYWPIILKNDDILMVTQQKNGKKPPQIEDNTYLEIFSAEGTKLLKCELPGYEIKTMQDTDGTIFLDTGCRSFPRRHHLRNSIKVFSINIS